MKTLLAGLVLLAASPAVAQSPQCGPREAVLEQLTEKFRENRRAIGLGGSGQVMELFASDETGSWTITVTLPNGMTCLMASGQAYEAMADALPIKGEDA